MSNETFNITNGLLAEFDGEIRTTRKALERLPQDKLLWKPHQKSMTAGQLALHIAELPSGVLSMGIKNSSEVPDLSHPTQPESVTQVLSALNSSESQVRDLLPTISDRAMHEDIRITKDGVDVMVLPRVAFLRLIMLNHWYHHRGQFSVYLRLLGCSVPSAYGPTADEL